MAIFCCRDGSRRSGTVRHFGKDHPLRSQSFCRARWRSAGIAAPVLAGCNGAPTVNILGSFFPSWMLCAIAGMVLALFAKQALAVAGIDKSLPAPLLVYLAFAAAFTFLLWLLWLS
jgi:YtcA-like protein